MTTRDIYYRRLEQGLCPQCGRRRDDGWITCSGCRAIKRASHAANRKQHAARNTEYVRELRRLRRKHKICQFCGSSDMATRTTCHRHRKLVREKNARAYQAKLGALAQEGTV